MVPYRFSDQALGVLRRRSLRLLVLLVAATALSGCMTAVTGLGIASMFRGEGDVSIPEIETAIELNPNFARAFVWLGFAHKWCRGDTPEIEVECYDTALRLSPRDPMRWFCLMHKGSALRMLRRHDEAVALDRKSTRLNSSHSSVSRMPSSA